MPTIYGAVDLVKNELRNAAIQNLGTAPATPVKGQLYFDTTSNVLYWWNGSQWIAAQGAAGAIPAASVTTSAVGDAPIVGTMTTYAREDHKHGREAFGAITTEQTFGVVGANGVATSLARSDHTHGNPVHDNAAHATISRSALAVPTGDISMAGFKITNLGAALSSTDAVTKGYVDAAVQGLTWKAAVRAATTTNITFSGTQTIDGVALASNDRVLVKNQTNAFDNGIYLCSPGTWVRALDMDLASEFVGAAVFVSEGTTQKDTSWVMTTDAPITIGTTPITWAQFAGSNTYQAGNGLTLAGNTFAVGAGTGILSTPGVTAVDTTVIATQAYVNSAITGMTKKFAAALAGTASPEVITHNLNTRDILVTVLNGASPYTAVEIDWDATTVNTATIRYNPNLGAGYRAVVVG